MCMCVGGGGGAVGGGEVGNKTATSYSANFS